MSADCSTIPRSYRTSIFPPRLSHVHQSSSYWIYPSARAVIERSLYAWTGCMIECNDHGELNPTDHFQARQLSCRLEHRCKYYDRVHAGVLIAPWSSATVLSRPARPRPCWSRDPHRSRGHHCNILAHTCFFMYHILPCSHQVAFSPVTDKFDQRQWVSNIVVNRRFSQPLTHMRSIQTFCKTIVTLPIIYEFIQEAAFFIQCDFFFPVYFQVCKGSCARACNRPRRVIC